jgi:hypothetical protein
MKAWEDKRCSRYQIILFGLYFDYNLFLYFILLPVIMPIALGIYHTSRFFSRIIDTYLFITKGNSPIKNCGNKLVLRLMPHLKCKFTSFLSYCLFCDFNAFFLAFAVKYTYCLSIFLFYCSATHNDYQFFLKSTCFQCFI